MSDILCDADKLEDTPFLCQSVRAIPAAIRRVLRAYLGLPKSLEQEYFNCIVIRRWQLDHGSVLVFKYRQWPRA